MPSHEAYSTLYFLPYILLLMKHTRIYTYKTEGKLSPCLYTAKEHHVHARALLAQSSVGLGSLAENPMGKALCFLHCSSIPQDMTSDSQVLL